jgi:hypothetical protein
MVAELNRSQVVVAQDPQQNKFADSLSSWVPRRLYLYTNNRCIYCGERADTLDHVFPLAFLTTMDRYNRSVKGIGVTVDCCRDCNNRLSMSMFYSFQDRLDCARERITKKNGKLIRLPHWEDVEIKKLHGGLRKLVKNRNTQREVVMQRLDWQTSPEFFECMDMLRKQVKGEHWDNEQLLRYFGCD